MANILDVLKPALLPRKFFGFLSIKFAESVRSKTYLERSNIHFLIWSIAQLFLTIMTAELYWTSFQYYSNLNSILEWMTYLLYYILDYVLFIISIFASKLDNDKMMTILNKMALIEKRLEILGVTLDYKLKYKIISIVILNVCIDVVHIVTLTYADYHSAKDVYASIYRSCITIYIDSAQITQAVLFVSVVLVVRDMLKKMMEGLDLKCHGHIHSLRSNVAQEYMIQTALIYQDIFENFREFLNVLGTQILLEFGVVFFVTIFHIFNLYIWIFHHGLDDKYATAVWFSICALTYALTAIVFYVVVSEAYHKVRGK